jgi:hypothetical protein
MIEKVNEGKGEEVLLRLTEGAIDPESPCYRLCATGVHPCGSQSLNGWDYAVGVIYGSLP